LHYMLPDSTLDQQKAKEHPGMFADTGIPLLFKSCYKLGAEKKRMVIKVAGAPGYGRHELFPDRTEKSDALRKIFWKNNVLIDAEDTGENYNRTVRLEIATGKFLVKAWVHVKELK